MFCMACGHVFDHTTILRVSMGETTHLRCPNCKDSSVYFKQPKETNIKTRITIDGE